MSTEHERAVRRESKRRQHRRLLRAGMKRLACYVPTEIHCVIAARSEKTGASMQEIIVDALRRGLQ